MRTSSPAARSCSPVWLGLAAALTSLIAGCSSAGLTAATASLPPTLAAKPSPTALSGLQLAGILLPASAMPEGYKAGPATRNSGSQLASDAAQPVPASQVCQGLTQSSYIRVAGITTSVWAEDDYVNAVENQEVFGEIDTFTGTDAQQAMAKLWREFGECSAFSYPSNGTIATNTLTRSRLPGTGGNGIKAVIVSPLFEGGTTLVAIRVGAQLITTLESSPGEDLGSPALGYAERIEQRLRAAQRG